MLDKPLENRLDSWHSKIILLLMFITFISFSLYQERTFSTQKQDAKHLIALNCPPAQCIVEGEIEYIATESGSRYHRNDKTYEYRYVFQVNNRTYYKNIKIYSGTFNRTKYLPSVEFDKTQKHKEKILFDPKNPNINLPEGYARVLYKHKGPVTWHGKWSLIFVIATAGWGILKLYFRKGQKPL